MDEGRFRELIEDERTLRMAKAILAEYHDINGYPSCDWDATDGTVTDYTRAKFLAAADSAFDAIEWVTFHLAPKDQEASHE